MERYVWDLSLVFQWCVLGMRVAAAEMGAKGRVYERFNIGGVAGWGNWGIVVFRYLAALGLSW